MFIAKSGTFHNMYIHICTCNRRATICRKNTIKKILSYTVTNQRNLIKYFICYSQILPCDFKYMRIALDILSKRLS